MKKIIFLLLFILGNFSYSYINIYPLKFEKNIEVEAFEEFVLYNRSNKPRKYRVYLEDIKNKTSMREWLKIYPKSITLNSLEEATVKVYVKAPSEAENGVYETNLVFKEVLLPTSKLSQEKSKKKTNILTMVKLRLKGKIER